MKIRRGTPLRFGVDGPKLAALGISVFPCAPASKRPLTRAAQPGASKLLRTGEIQPGDPSLGGFHRASADPLEVEKWARMRPEAYVGIPCGSPFAPISALDLDRTEAQKAVDVGHSGVDKLFEVLGDGADDVMAAGWEVRTASGGIHLIFQEEWTLGNKQNVKHLDGLIDFRGKTSGYIIAYRSHPDGDQGEWWHNLESLLPVPHEVRLLFEKPLAEVATPIAMPMGEVPAQRRRLPRYCKNPACGVFGHLERLVEGARSLTDGRQDVPGRIGRLIGGYAAGRHISESGERMLADELIRVIDGYGAEYHERHPEDSDMRVMRAVTDGRSAPIRDCAQISGDDLDDVIESFNDDFVPEEEISAPATASTNSPPWPPDSVSEVADSLPEPPDSAPATASTNFSPPPPAPPKWKQAMMGFFDVPSSVELVDFVKHRRDRRSSYYVIHAIGPRGPEECEIDDIASYPEVAKKMMAVFSVAIKREVKRGDWYRIGVMLDRSVRVHEETGPLTNEAEVEQWVRRIIRAEDVDSTVYEYDYDTEDWLYLISHLRGADGALGESAIMHIEGQRVLAVHNSRVIRLIGESDLGELQIRSGLREYGFKERRLRRAAKDGKYHAVRLWYSARAMGIVDVEQRKEE